MITIILFGLLALTAFGCETHDECDLEGGEYCDAEGVCFGSMEACCSLCDGIDGTCPGSECCTPTEECTNLNTMEEGCDVNQIENCDWWASLGQCEDNPDFMLTCCKATCGACPPTGENDGGNDGGKDGGNDGGDGWTTFSTDSGIDEPACETCMMDAALGNCTGWVSEEYDDENINTCKCICDECFSECPLTMETACIDSLYACKVQCEADPEDDACGAVGLLTIIVAAFLALVY